MADVPPISPELIGLPVMACCLYGPPKCSITGVPQALRDLRRQAVCMLACLPNPGPDRPIPHSLGIWEAEGILRVKAMDEWSALETPGSSVWDQLPDGDILRVEWVKGLGPRGNQQAELLVLDIARLEHWSTQLAYLTVGSGEGAQGPPSSPQQEEEEDGYTVPVNVPRRRLPPGRGGYGAAYGGGTFPGSNGATTTRAPHASNDGSTSTSRPTQAANGGASSSSSSRAPHSNGSSSTTNGCGPRSPQKPPPPAAPPTRGPASVASADNEDPHAAMISKLSSRGKGGKGLPPVAPPPDLGPPPPPPPHLVQMAAAAFPGNTPESVLRRLAVEKLSIVGLGNVPEGPKGPCSMDANELNAEFRSGARSAWAAINPTRQPAGWTASSRDKIKASRWGAVLVDAAGFIIREEGNPVQYVVILDKPALAAVAGMQLPPEELVGMSGASSQGSAAPSQQQQHQHQHQLATETSESAYDEPQWGFAEATSSQADDRLSSRRSGAGVSHISTNVPPYSGQEEYAPACLSPINLDGLRLLAFSVYRPDASSSAIKSARFYAACVLSAVTQNSLGPFTMMATQLGTIMSQACPDVWNALPASGSRFNKLADSVIVTQPVKSNMAVLLHVEGLQEQAAEKVLAALPAGVLLAPGTCGDNTWGAEDAGLDLEGFPDLSNPSPATNWIRVLAICKYRPFSDADHTTKLRLTAACLLAGAAQPGPAGRYSIGASEMEHLLSVTCPASWEGLPAFDASRLEALQDSVIKVEQVHEPEWAEVVVLDVAELERAALRDMAAAVPAGISREYQAMSETWYPGQDSDTASMRSYATSGAGGGSTAPKWRDPVHEPAPTTTAGPAPTTADFPALGAAPARSAAAPGKPVGGAWGSAATAAAPTAWASASKGKAASAAPPAKAPSPAPRAGGGGGGKGRKGAGGTNKKATDDDDVHAAMFAKLASRGKGASLPPVAPAPTGPAPLVPPRLLRLAAAVFPGSSPEAFLRRLAVTKLGVVGEGNIPIGPLGPRSMLAHELTTALRMDASDKFGSIQVPARAPAHQWASREDKLRASRLGVLLVDAPGLDIIDHGLEQVVILDEDALAAAAGEVAQPAPAGRSDGGSGCGGTSTSGSSHSTAFGYGVQQVSNGDEEADEAEMLDALLGSS